MGLPPPSPARPAPEWLRPVGAVVAAFAVAVLARALALPDVHGMAARMVEGVVLAALSAPALRWLWDRDADHHQPVEPPPSAFDGRLHRALEMADDEAAVLDVVSRAVERVAPDAAAELLVAPTGTARLRSILTVGPAGARDPVGAGVQGRSCPVRSTSDCPALRSGRTTVFTSSADLDACRFLRERPGDPRSAVCVPITVMGDPLGVLHTTAADQEPPTPDEITPLEAVASQAGSRIALARALNGSSGQVSTDPLTGLLSPRSLESEVHDLIHDLVPFTVAVGDLDHFRQLNAAHGQEAGDQALRVFARLLTHTVRPDDIVARSGGEQFVVVFPGCSPDDAAAALERVRESLALSVAAGETPGFTASFGVADSSQGRSIPDILARAGQALATAKRRGRNRVVVAAPQAPGGSDRPG